MLERNKGSFRDPVSTVFHCEKRIFRRLDSSRFENTKKFLNSAFYRERQSSDIVKTKIVDSDPIEINNEARQDYFWLEHQQIDLITYPYEWPFELLKKAALFHLRLLLEALDNDWMIKDSSAFNIQYIGTKPIFIDLPSFEPYRPGQPWIGYKQFCEHFLAPLVLEHYTQIEFNCWFKGRLDGLDIGEVSKALPLSSYLSFTVLSHIHIHGKLLRNTSSMNNKKHQKSHERCIPKKNLTALIRSLESFVTKLSSGKKSFWQEYYLKTNYSDENRVFKEQFVSEYCATNAIETLIDLGCNAGAYSKLALRSGVENIIGLDIDSNTLDKAVLDSDFDGANFTPLKFDIMNPSSGCGWSNKERATIKDRFPKIDGLLCLALIHHLAIGKNVPLELVIDEVLSLSPRGIIEFVAKEDEMVRGLLSSREDIFPHYSPEHFEELLSHRAKITKTRIPDSHRYLFTFETAQAKK